MWRCFSQLVIAFSQDRMKRKKYQANLLEGLLILYYIYVNNSSQALQSSANFEVRVLYVCNPICRVAPDKACHPAALTMLPMDTCFRLVGYRSCTPRTYSGHGYLMVA